MLIAFCLNAKTAKAELPKGDRRGSGSSEVMCYDLENFTLLLQMDSDLTICHAEVTIRTHLADDLKLQVKTLKELVAVTEDNNTILKTENTRLFELWKEENKRRHEAENAPKWGSWMGWIVAGVATAVAGGAITYAVVK